MQHTTQKYKEPTYRFKRFSINLPTFHTTSPIKYKITIIEAKNNIKIK